MKYLLRATTAIILAEMAVHWIQANITEYWPMFPYALTLDMITYDTERWWSSWSPFVYAFFLLAAFGPEIISQIISPDQTEQTVLDDI